MADEPSPSTIPRSEPAQPAQSAEEGAYGAVRPPTQSNQTQQHHLLINQRSRKK